MKTAAYFQAMRLRPDRAVIRDEWIERAVLAPLREHTQADGRIRRWVRIPEAVTGSFEWSCCLMVKRFTTRSLIGGSRYEDPALAPGIRISDDPLRKTISGDVSGVRFSVRASGEAGALMATVRSSRVSTLRYTCPIPP